MLEVADITPIHKRGKKMWKKIIGQLAFYPFYRKYLKKICLNISDYFEGIFDKHHCGFRKGYNTQQCLLKLLEKWKSSVDKGRDFDVLLTNLPKAFEFLDHELPIAKLDAYGFSLLAAILIHDYLSNRKQRTRTGNSYSS